MDTCVSLLVGEGIHCDIINGRLVIQELKMNDTLYEFRCGLLPGKIFAERKYLVAEAYRKCNGL